ncbi:hypothetical protein RclHR1_06600001 [Rhizophagus clarus]|uniref:Uncharacterized protein n=1 Tax=Rhizophagus clarus TaxID=94130 RepID=A0A2Z6SJ02_9GLOM|nr:hypothetical protein RclHR1_06600001 [Rhizophagus clarus]
MASSLYRILIVDTHVEFGEFSFFDAVCSLALWTRNLTRMIFDETSSLWMCEFDDVLSDYYDMGFRQTGLLNIYDKDY